MEEKEELKTNKFAIEYGILTGGTGLIFAVMLFILDAHYENSTSTQIINGTIQLVGVTIACIAFKKANYGFITLSQALKTGVGVSLILAIMSVTYTLLLTNFVEPDFMDKALKISYNNTLEQYPEALANMDLNQYISAAKPYTWFSYPAILMITLFFGFIESLIVGLIIQKK